MEITTSILFLKFHKMNQLESGQNVIYKISSSLVSIKNRMQRGNRKKKKTNNRMQRRGGESLGKHCIIIQGDIGVLHTPSSPPPFKIRK